MLIVSVRDLRDGFVVVLGRIGKLREWRQDLFVGGSFELCPGFLYGSRFVGKGLGKAQFN